MQNEICSRKLNKRSSLFIILIQYINTVKSRNYESRYNAMSRNNDKKCTDRGLS